MKKFKFKSIAAFAAASLLAVSLTGCHYKITLIDGSEDSTDGGSGGVDAVVSYIDVGQGDCELIQAGGYNVLIDGGEKGSGDTIISYLESQNISKIDYVVASHPHSDHIGGLNDVMYSTIKGKSDIKIGEVFTCDLADSIIPSTKVFTYFLQDIDDIGAEFKTVDERMDIELGSEDCVLTLIPSPYNNDKNLNNESVVAVLKNGDNTFLFTGDAEKEEETELVKNGAFDDVKNVDVYKAGHHGSSNASSDELLSAVSPKNVVISCGAGNSYGHPHKEALQRFSDHNATVYRTDLQGTVTVKSDGKNISFETEK